MATNDWAKLLNTMTDAWKQISEQIKELVDALVKVFGSLRQARDRSYKNPNTYYNPHKNKHLRGKMLPLYKVYIKPQKHLPYQRRAY